MSFREETWLTYNSVKLGEFWMESSGVIFPVMSRREGLSLY